MSRIGDEFLSCAAYLYPSKEAADAGEKAGGSGFLVGIEIGQKAWVIFAVTNRHVVTSAPVIRLKHVDGTTVVQNLEAANWIHHPDGDDLSVAALEVDFAKLIYTFVPSSVFITFDIMVENNIGPGDDVFMIGRFIGHDGKSQNNPSVRFGNISMWPAPIRNERFGLDQESFAVEMRSLSGYSGSPVFVFCQPGVLRPPTDGGSPKKTAYYMGPYLLGIDWCHITQRAELLDGLGKPMGNKHHVALNSGMAGVIPAWKLTSLFASDRCQKIINQQKRRYEATPAGQA